MQRNNTSKNLINELIAINTQQTAPLIAAKYKISHYLHFQINQLPCSLDGPSSQGEYKRIYSKKDQCNIIELFVKNHQDIVLEEKAGRLNKLPNIADLFYHSYQETLAKAEINEFLRRPIEDKKRETKDNTDVFDSFESPGDIDNFDEALFQYNFYLYYLYNYVSNNFCKDPDSAEIFVALFLCFHGFIARHLSISSQMPPFAILSNCTKLDSFSTLIVIALVKKLVSEIENPQEILLQLKKIHHTEIRARVIEEFRGEIEPEYLIKLPFDLDKWHLHLEKRTRLLKELPINDQQADACLNPTVYALFKHRRIISSVDDIIGIIAAYITPIEENDAVGLLKIMKSITKKEKDLFNHRHETNNTQHSFDKRFGVIPHPILSGYSLFDKKNDNHHSQSAFDKRFGLLPYVSKPMKLSPFFMFYYLNCFIFELRFNYSYLANNITFEPSRIAPRHNLK